MRPVLLTAAAVILLLSSAPPAGADWVIAAFLGATRTGDATLRVEQPADGTAVEARDVAFAGRAFESPFYYGYRVMWAPARRDRFGVEAELIHLKVHADTAAIVRTRGRIGGAPGDRTIRLAEIVERFSISHGLNLLLVNLVLRHPLGGDGPLRKRRFVLAIRAGAGPTLPHAESTIGGRTQEQYEWGRVAGQAAAGIECRVARDIAALVEYKLTATSQRVSVPAGTASATFVTQHVAAGLAWRF
jgi:hypothetical protein